MLHFDSCSVKLYSSLLELRLIYNTANSDLQVCQRIYLANNIRQALMFS